MKRTGWLAIATATAAVAAGVPAAAAPALPAPDGSKHCGIATKGSAEYRVKARAVRCRFARRWVKRYFRSGRVAPGFTLTETSGGKAPWYCTKGDRKAYWPERL
jgi:hypothetical protein